jgi:hypothetical protein
MPLIASCLTDLPTSPYHRPPYLPPPSTFPSPPPPTSPLPTFLIRVFMALFGVIVVLLLLNLLIARFAKVR